MSTLSGVCCTVEALGSAGSRELCITKPLPPAGSRTNAEPRGKHSTPRSVAGRQMPSESLPDTGAFSVHEDALSAPPNMRVILPEGELAATSSLGKGPFISCRNVGSSKSSSVAESLLPTSTGGSASTNTFEAPKLSRPLSRDATVSVLFSGGVGKSIGTDGAFEHHPRSPPLQRR